jgi:hypothetical protein
MQQQSKRISGPLLLKYETGVTRRYRTTPRSVMCLDAHARPFYKKGGEEKKGLAHMKAALHWTEHYMLYLHETGPDAHGPSRRSKHEATAGSGKKQRIYIHS